MVSTEDRSVHLLNIHDINILVSGICVHREHEIIMKSVSAVIAGTNDPE